MTQRQWAAMAVRVLAIYAIINSLGWLQNNLSLLLFALGNNGRINPVPLWQYAVSFAPFTAFATCGVLLWIFADALAYFMADTTDHNASATTLQAVEVLTMAFCVIGIWFTLSALPRLAQAVGASLWPNTTTASRISASIGLPAELVLSAPQIAIGLGLFFGARKIADKLAARYRFSPPVSQDPVSQAPISQE